MDKELMDQTGTYDPIPKPPTDGEGKPFKDIKLDSARAKYWLGVGAQPSDPAWRLLTMVSWAVGAEIPASSHNFGYYEEVEAAEESE
ncbi:hypothetical protein D0Z07_9242 [Hyphodiscus hymeniophilus]|uniref:Ribosomal protein S16 n=1 Tax=Hyphodiscus hymeniophilus TaxID=353542 RepID=A0A9P6SPZ7_9HELO|nr:hypothetical protein D0Z07_9242 [Hyphodiscus hymeniophilus]